MITRKDITGKSWLAYADKPIPADKHFIPSPELIQYWRLTRWSKKEGQLRTGVPLNARPGKG